MKHALSDVLLKNTVLKKVCLVWTRRRTTNEIIGLEKVEVIRIVVYSELSIRQTLAELGISRTSFYRWYQRYKQGGIEAHENRFMSAIDMSDVRLMSTSNPYSTTTITAVVTASNIQPKWRPFVCYKVTECAC